MPTLSWSPEAETRFDRWLAPRLTVQALDGADPGEVAEDWRLHVEEELARRGESPGDAEALGRVLAALDHPAAKKDADVPVAPSPPQADAPAGSPRHGGRASSQTLPANEPAGDRRSTEFAGDRRATEAFRWPKVFCFFGIILPLVTVVAEWIFGLCAGTFFDPLPTWGHAVMVALVPLALWFLLASVQKGNLRGMALARPAAGFVFPVATYYTAAFGGLLPIAGMGLFFGIMTPLFWPLTWMTLSPVFVLLAGFMGLRRLSRAQKAAGQKPSHAWLGVLLGVAALGALEGPRWWTHLTLADAVSTNPEVSEPAIRSLRRWGVASVVHQACFEGQNTSLGNGSPAGWMLAGHSFKSFRPFRFSRLSVPIVKAREVYFRVTGKAFNEVKPSHSHTPVDIMGSGRADRARATQWVWDGERGGDTVGARLPGLALASSRLEWHVEAAPRLAYGEWTMEFSNAHANDQEARGQVLLPPGACVSRLTLWVNGEPQEAAFAANAQVKAAYKEVVTVERRDPVLVTQAGPDRVLVQCFPVPRDGGRIKIRLGLTAPLDDAGRLWQPSFIERNFSMPESLRHALWVQSRAPFESSAGLAGSTEKNEAGATTWQAELSHDTLSLAHLRWAAPPSGELLWCEDALAAEGEARFVTGRWSTETQPPLSQLFIVIDGSASLREHRAALRRALASLPGGVRARLWLTTDEGARELDRSRLESELSAGHFLGGQNAAPGLKAALSAARETTEPAAIVWLHGPQPADLPGAEGLEQMLALSLRRVPIYAVSVAPGPHRLLEKLYRASSLRAAGRLGDNPADLPAWLNHLASGGTRARLHIERQNEPPADGVKVSDQLARHAAFAQTLDAFHTGASETVTLAATAARHQVVTPYSGAVVLERKEQYERHGLSQVDVSSVPKVPTIPEPGVLWLAAASLALALRRRRAREG